jgi:GT2 family glycosyltransferase
MTAPPLVSVVVLNYNGASIIGRCLDHLHRQIYPRVQIVVVDNASTDGSLEILEAAEAAGEIVLVRSATNRGVASGRNLGLTAAEGSVVAFMDNDGYASPAWLSEAVRALQSDPTLGAVASVVFFNKRKIILNGAGGTVNRRGYGADFCFNEPFEYASLPQHVLYPMGCGMVIRRDVMDAISPLDDLLFNYYDDVEVGIRIWQSGYRVGVAPEAWVDHDFGYSDEINRNKVLLCERNRIRNVLKYFPLSRLPIWLLQEGRMGSYLRSAPLRDIPLRAWAWNLAHLPSALRCRLRFARGRKAFWPLLYPTCEAFPPPLPNNQALRPDPSSATPRLQCDGEHDAAQLNFGWYAPERDGERCFRWTAGVASAILRFPGSIAAGKVTWRAPRVDQQATLLLRRLGELRPLRTIEQAAPTCWEDTAFACVAPPGLYELQIQAEPTYRERAGRSLGVAIASIEFV